MPMKAKAGLRASREYKERLFYTYQEIQEVIYLSCIQSQAEYQRLNSADKKIPSDPQGFYPEFKNWATFLRIAVFSPEEVMALEEVQKRGTEKGTKIQLASLENFLKRLSLTHPRVPRNYKWIWNKEENKRFRELILSRLDNTVGHLRDLDITRRNSGVHGFSVTKRGYHRVSGQG